MRTLISTASIQRRVRALGARVAADHAGRAPTILGVLDGACVFVADLMRAVPLPDVRLRFVRATSYVGTTSTGGVQVVVPDGLAGQDVVVVDEILDTGRTLRAVVDAVHGAGAASVRTCVLLDKPSRRVPGGLPKADAVGFTIPDLFVIGYGLDLDGKFRHLPDIRIWEP